jgi:hypothetical protein
MYICMYICTYMRLFLPYVLHTVWCLSKSYAHINNCKKKRTCTVIKGEKDKTGNKNTTAQIGTNVRVRGYKAGLLDRSQFALGKSCDRPIRSRFSVVFLGPRADAELVPKFKVALYASHAALPMVTLKISSCTNVTLGWVNLHGLHS